MNVPFVTLAVLAFLLSACTGEHNSGNIATVEEQSQLSQRNPQRHLNILLILVDDLGKEWVPLYGGNDVGMPNLKALAAQGAIFDNAYVNPQCTPTRMSLLTGQYPFRHGWVNHWDAPRWGHGYYDWRLNPSLGRAMRAAGYATVAAGKWQVNDFRLTPDAMDKHGFTDYLMWTGYEADNDPSAERYWDPYLHSKDGSRAYPNEFGEDLFTEFLLDYIEQQNDQPWFAYYPMVLPHVPFTSTPDEIDAKGEDAQFRAMIRYVDSVLGRFTKLLEQKGLRDDTIVIWMTDNGSDPQVVGSLNGREVRGAKSSTTEAGVNVPFVISAPGMAAGVREDALIDISDLFPTFVELAGGEMPQDYEYDGLSFAPLIKGDAQDSQRHWIMAMGGQNRAKVSDQGIENEYSFRDRVVRDKRFKLYLKASPELGFEKLVDLAVDPEEEVNLLGSNDPEIRKAHERLAAVVELFPKVDNDPQYTPRAANSWDVQKSVESQVWKK